jgi:hypothetical protein
MSDSGAKNNFSVGNATNLQVGDHNTLHGGNQLIQSVELLRDAIDKSSASDSDKKAAKSHLLTFFENPTVSNVLGALATSAIGLLK